MNNFDIENIKKIIKSRKPIKYSDKGDENIEVLKTLSTKELSKKIKEYKDNVFNKNKTEFKEIVKHLFDTYAEGDDNILILSQCWGDYDGGRELHYTDPELDSYGDISNIYQRETYNEWAQSIDFDDTNDDIVEDINKCYKRLWELMPELNIDFAENVYCDDHAVNCYWHGHVCVTKDYKILNFICRNDNMMLKDEKRMPEPVMEL